MASILAWAGGLRDLLADTTAWRTLCGAADATEAKRSIRFETIDLDEPTQAVDGRLETLQIKMPLAVILNVAHGYAKSGDGDLNTFLVNGQVDLILALATPFPDDYQASYESVYDTIGGILDELAEKIATSVVRFQGIECLQPPLRSTLADRTEGNDYFWTRYAFHHDAGGGD